MILGFIFILFLLILMLCTLPILFIWLYNKQQEQNLDVTISYLQNKEVPIIEKQTIPIVAKFMERIHLVAKE